MKINQPQPQPQKQQQNYQIKGYKFLTILGTGAYGTVYKVIKDNQYFAIKTLSIKRSQRIMRYVKNEIAIMKMLNQENIVHLIETFEDNTFIYIVMEICNHGTLYDYVVNKKPNEQKCIQIFSQLLKGFTEMHEKQVLHRDLKPQNIFIQDDVFKIADFGVSKPVNLSKSYVGTPYFMSPEIQKKRDHDYKTDLWSLGVILYFMLFREYPFKNRKNLLYDIKQKCKPYFDVRKYNQRGKYLSQECQSLFRYIFIEDPSKRISFQKLYDLPIFKPYFQENELEKSRVIYEHIETMRINSKQYYDGEGNNLLPVDQNQNQNQNILGAQNDKDNDNAEEDNIIQIHVEEDQNEQNDQIQQNENNNLIQFEQTPNPDSNLNPNIIQNNNNKNNNNNDNNDDSNNNKKNDDDDNNVRQNSPSKPHETRKKSQFYQQLNVNELNSKYQKFDEKNQGGSEMEKEKLKQEEYLKQMEELKRQNEELQEKLREEQRRNSALLQEQLLTFNQKKPESNSSQQENSKNIDKIKENSLTGSNSMSRSCGSEDNDYDSQIMEEGIANYSNLLFSTEKNGKGPQAQISVVKTTHNLSDEEPLQQTFNGEENSNSNYNQNQKSIRVSPQISPKVSHRQSYQDEISEDNNNNNQSEKSTIKSIIKSQEQICFQENIQDTVNIYNIPKIENSKLPNNVNEQFLANGQNQMTKTIIQNQQDNLLGFQPGILSDQKNNENSSNNLLSDLQTPSFNKPETSIHTGTFPQNFNHGSQQKNKQNYLESHIIPENEEFTQNLCGKQSQNGNQLLVNNNNTNNNNLKGQNDFSANTQNHYFYLDNAQNQNTFVYDQNLHLNNHNILNMSTIQLENQPQLYNEMTVNDQQAYRNNNVEPEELLKSKVRQMQQSKFIHPRNDMFEEHNYIYNQEIQKYNFVCETIDFLKQMKFDEYQQMILNYSLTKLMTIMASSLKNTLLFQKNDYNLKNFEEFCSSNDGDIIVQQVDEDLNIWNTKFFLYYFSIDQDEIKDGRIKDFVNEKNGVKDHMEFSSIKVPLRLVLDPVFKTCYKLGKKKDKKYPNSLNILKTALMILLCMLINNIFAREFLFDRFTDYFKVYDDWSLFSYVLWIKQANRVQILDQIHGIIDTAFGSQRLNYFLKL